MTHRFSFDLRRFPTGAAGLALGLISSGSLLQLYGYQQPFTLLLACPIVLLLLIKLSWNIKLLWSELQHPLLGSVIPTLCMSAMLLSSQLSDKLFSSVIWYSAVILHLILLCAFIYRQSSDFNLEKLLPSWFIPPVGLAVAALTYPDVQSLAIAEYLLYFAIGSYFLLLPVILYRLILLPSLVDGAKPSLAILAAPPNLCLAAYLSLVQQPSILLVCILLSLGVLMTAVVYLCLIKLLTLEFSPAFAAFTFPLVISATAMTKASSYFSQFGLQQSVVSISQYLAHAELGIALVMLVYVLCRYVMFYSRLPKFIGLRFS
ncbi:MAG: TDT family transporter [Oceanospirillaceae bacterium]|nr:TDT family transporter [Oceanospirillaceae bacterium]